MRLARFLYNGEERFGVVENDQIKVVEGDMWGEFYITSRVYPLEKVRLLAPTNPAKIIAIGVNYRDHAEEFGKELPSEPLIFLKPSSAVIGHQDDIVYPLMSRRVDFEGELGIVIGAIAKDVPEQEADRYIRGYTCFNDVTARDLQRKDGQWSRAKGFDTFAPLGPWIETEIDPLGLRLETFLNGERRQSSTTSNLIFKPRQLVSFISQIMTLCPGDVIATGTPSGVGPMKVGDRVEVVIEGIGRLMNFVKQG